VNVILVGSTEHFGNGIFRETLSLVTSSAAGNVEMKGPRSSSGNSSREPIGINDVMPTDLGLHSDQRRNDVVCDHPFVSVGAVEHDIGSEAGRVPGPVVADGADFVPSELWYDAL
jgi:hypothetical protein